METTCSIGSCPLTQISWIWYAVSVIVVFASWYLWYAVLFNKQWKVGTSGSDLSEGDKCACKSAAKCTTFCFQFIATALIGLMYFILSGVSVWLSVIVAIAVCGWMKSDLRFQIADCKHWIAACCFKVGFFFLVSVIFILFSLINCTAC